MPSGSHKPRGVFVNVPEANCSIYESGRMVYGCLTLSDRYELTYVEIDEFARDLDTGVDFYAFNYHHVRMSWLDPASVRRLPGLKLTFVLETLPGNPFILCPPDAFDAYCALDPTMAIADNRVFAFPRPLETPPPLPAYVEPPVPVIGTFGFATRGKGFELVVDAVNREFDRAVVRINIPSSTFAHRPRSFLAPKDYAQVLSDLCVKTAKPGVDVVITHDYLSKPDLIRWCARNTLNCFLYDRNLPGLSATTDQAIVSGRPLAVSTNPTFRHIHPFITPYPAQRLRESIAASPRRVAAMQEEWTPRNFALRFEQVLEAYGMFSDRAHASRPPEFIHLDRKTLPVSFAGRCRRFVHKVRYAIEDLADSIRPVQNRDTLCKFLLSRAEVRACTAYLQGEGYPSHRLACKDWDIANIIKDLSDGDLLDMGSSDSFLLASAVRKGIRGRKIGVDLQRPDVPVDGVTYLIGDLTNTGLAEGTFANITCLSVIEHDVDFGAFAREAARLLVPGGKLYVTFDYWTPRLLPRLRLFGRPWRILDRNDVELLVITCGGETLALTQPIDWTLGAPVINGRYYAPDPLLAYTFGMLVFHKTPQSPIHSQE